MFAPTQFQYSAHHSVKSIAFAREYALDQFLPTACHIVESTMESLQCWIAPLVRSSLADFLNPDEDLSPGGSAPNFQYHNDVSNLRIIPAKPVVECLQLLDFRDQRTDLKASVCDRDHSVHAILSKDAIKSEFRTNLPGLQLRKGSWLQVRELEIRVADCYDPPRIEFRIKSFIVLDFGDRDARKRRIKPLEADRGIKDRALQCKARRGQNMATFRDDDSSPFRSQVSSSSTLPRRYDDDDEENQDSSSISQARFVTQVPIPPQPKVSRKPLQPMQNQHSSPQADMFVLIPDTSSRARAAPPWNKTGQIEYQRQDRSRKVLAGSNSSSDKKGSPTSNTEDKAITSGAMNSDLLNSAAPPTQQAISAISLHATTEKKGVVLSRLTCSTRHFQRWRNGGKTSIPRYATKIAKDQVEILESEQSWQPPLVGKPLLEGTVPLSLLNVLTASADCIFAEAQADPTPISDAKISFEPDEKGQPTNSEGGHDGTDESRSEMSDVDEDSSAEVGASQWPPSPAAGAAPQASQAVSDLSDASRLPPWDSSLESNPPKCQQLPPDSSPLKQVESVVEPITVDEEGDEDEEIQSEARSQSDVFEDAITTTAEREASAEKETGGMRTDKQLQMPAKLNETNQASLVTQKTSTLRFGSTASTSKKLIQAKRTPYLPTMPHPPADRDKAGKRRSGSLSTNIASSSAGDHLSHSSPSFIASTFDDRGLLPSLADTVESPSSHKPQAPENFEDGSSEDGEMGMLNERQPHNQRDGQKTLNRSPRTSVQIVDPDREHEVRHSSMKTNISTRIANPTGGAGEPITATRDGRTDSKRKALDSTDTSSSKRSKIMAPPEPLGNTRRNVNPDYVPVNETMRNWRRAHLNQITPQVEALGSQISNEAARLRSEFLHTDSEARSKSNQSSFVSQRQQVSTPVTQSSVPQMLSEERLGSLLSSEVSRCNQSGPADVYDLYKRTYPDYGGTFAHFENGCTLIRDLRQKGQAVHPYLWDDFIFRLVHDYQEYVVKIMALGGSVEVYPLFYDQHVEEPKHLKRIVLPILIDGLGNSSGIEITRLMGREGSNADHSVAAESSISNVLPRGLPCLQNSGSPGLILGMDRQEQDCLINAQVQEIDTQIENSCIDRSQDSSVRLWLEKAPGLESPDLGTPDKNGGHADIPIMDLDTAATEEIASQAGLNEVESELQRPGDIFDLDLVTRDHKLPAYPSSAPHATCAACVNPRLLGQLSQDGKLIQEGVQAVSVQQHQKASDFRLPDAGRLQRSTHGSLSKMAPPPADHNELLVQSEQSHHFADRASSNVKQQPKVAPVPQPVSRSQRIYVKKEQEWWEDDDTPFKHFMSNYSKLPSEQGIKQVGVETDDARNGYVDADVTKVVDIFSWRRRC